MKRILVGIAIAVVAGVICAALAWIIAIYIALSPSCGLDVLSEKKSPDAAFIMTLYTHDCGATTSGATLLSIRRADEEFDPEDTEDVLIVRRFEPVTAVWVDSGRIQVEVPKRAEIFRKDQEWNGIAISYIER
jgi:hypothetical protein